MRGRRLTCGLALALVAAGCAKVPILAPPTPQAVATKEEEFRAELEEVTKRLFDLRKRWRCTTPRAIFYPDCMPYNLHPWPPPELLDWTW